MLLRSSAHVFAGVTLLATAHGQAAAAGGDPAVVEFVHPFAAARERAAATHRLLFLKPVYGGMDEAGAQSYCRGVW